MDIGALSTAMSMSDLATNIGVALCDMAMEDMEVNADGLRKIMEQSVNPYVGQNFDVTV